MPSHEIDDEQPLRRRASGNVRAVDAHTQLAATAVTNGISESVETCQSNGRNEKDAAESAGSPPLPEAASQTKSQKLTKWYLSPAWVSVALVLLFVSALSLLSDPSAQLFASVRDLSQGPEHGFGILLHPEEHIYRSADIVEHWWSISTGFRSPDGVRKRVYLINGKDPYF